MSRIGVQIFTHIRRNSMIFIRLHNSRGRGFAKSVRYNKFHYRRGREWVGHKWSPCPHCWCWWCRTAGAAAAGQNNLQKNGAFNGPWNVLLFHNNFSFSGKLDLGVQLPPLLQILLLGRGNLEDIEVKN